MAEGIHDLRSELNQICWDQVCSQRECEIKFDPDNEHKWILGTPNNDKYKDSRTKVIGKAIGDCVAEKNEFKDMRSDDIITFENATSEPKDYEQKHWNAVILYNYVHEMINGNNLPADKAGYSDQTQNVYNMLKHDKMQQLYTYYKQYDQTGLKLSRAIRDIQQYVDALKLNEYLYEFRTSKWKYKTERTVFNVVPHVSSLKTNDDSTIV